MPIVVEDSPLPVQGPAVVTNAGSDVLYYRDEAPVSAAENDGSLAAGASMSIAGAVYFVAATESRSVLTVGPQSTGVAVLREAPLNPRDPFFGAQGDGTTNDTVAVQAALNLASSVPRSRVVFEDGRIFRTTQLALPNNITLEGGGTIKRYDTATESLLNAATLKVGIELRRLILDGNGTAGNLFTLPNGSTDLDFVDCVFQNYTGSAAAISLGTGALTNKRLNLLRNLFSGDTTAVNVQACILHGSDVTIRGNRFIGGAVGMTYSSGITEVPRNIRIIDNDWRDCIASCVLIRPSAAHIIEDVQLIGNRTYHTGIGDPANTLYKGFAVVGENNVAGLSITKRVVIADNVVKWFGGHAISLGGGSGQGCTQDVTVEGNVIDGSDGDDNYATTGTGWENGTGITAIGCNGFSFCGNRIRKVGLSGIRVYGATLTPAQPAQHGVISGNSIEEVAIKTDLANIDLECGIKVVYFANNLVISNNIVKNTGRQLGTQSGIGLGQTATAGGQIDNVVIRGNRCYDDRGTPYQAYGLSLGAAAANASQPTDVVVQGNDFGGNATDAYITFNSITRGYRVSDNVGTVTPTVASAATVELKPEPMMYVSGTTTIDTLNGGWAGREITLIFTGACTVSEVGNVKLSAAWTSSADDVLCLACDGTSWYEKSRSAN